MTGSSKLENLIIVCREDHSALLQISRRATHIKIALEVSVSSLNIDVKGSQNCGHGEHNGTLNM